MKTTSQLLRITFVCIFVLQCYIHSSFAQSQKGLDIDGETAYDNSGFAVSMPDVNTVAIGALNNGGTASGAGHVRIYEWSGIAWTQKGTDIDGEAADDQSGYSVSMPDANTVAIGAHNHDGNGSNAGQVKIYEWNGNTWVQKGLDIDGIASNDYAGRSVYMVNANTVALGAMNASNAGRVRIYSWTGSAWTQKGLDINGEAIKDNSGHAISMPNENTIAIGAPRNDGNGTDAGHVRVYSWNGSTWIQKGNDINGEDIGDYFGYSVSMPDENTVAIGAPYNDGNGPTSGHVRIYEWNGNAWTKKGMDINGESAGDISGWSISMPDANTIAIGAYNNGGTGSGAGHVRIYKWNGTTWTQSGTDIDGEAVDDQSGYSVSMPDVSTIAIGARHNGGNGVNAGQVRVFSLCTHTTGTDVITACDTYTWIDGITYTSSNNTAKHTLTNAAGCDSLITLDLTINNVSDITTSTDGLTITAMNTAATYVWLDCGNNFEPIQNEVNQSFTATSNGHYAVQLTENGCVDTSECVAITTVNIIENSFQDNFMVFPNPTSGEFSIRFENMQDQLILSLFSVNGQLIKKETAEGSSRITFEIDAPAGVYLLKISNSKKQEALFRIVKE